MALTCHDAARRDHSSRAEAELLGAEQGSDDHIPAGAQSAVHPHPDPVAQTVLHEHAHGLCQPHLPMIACVLDGSDRCGARTTFASADLDYVGISLGHT